MEAIDWVPCEILTTALSPTYVLACRESLSTKCRHSLVSTDDFAGPLELQTNFVLKGIIGINAISKIAATIDNDADNRYFKVRGSKWNVFS